MYVTYVIFTKMVPPTKFHGHRMVAFGGKPPFLHADDAEIFTTYPVNPMQGHSWNHRIAAEKLREELGLTGPLTKKDEAAGYYTWTVKEEG